MARISFLLCTIWLSVGCAAISEMPRPERAPAWSTWSRVHGGVLAAGAPLASRAERALDRVRGGAMQPVCIRVLDEEAVGAYAWRDGSIFVTRGLLHVMDDEELDAAIAHEMAHLGTEATDASRRGDHHGSEARADAGGLEILRATGRHRPESMLDMLNALSPHAPRALAPSMAARIALVRDRIAYDTASAAGPGRLTQSLVPAPR